MSGRWFAAVAAAVLATLACSKGEADEAFRPLQVGSEAPAYAVQSFAGDTVRLGGTGDVTVLNVWATWCTSCREEMSDLKALSAEFGSRGVRVVGVSVDAGDGRRVRRFAEAEQLTFTVGHDPEQRIQRLYQVVGVPETIVVGRNGRILWRYVGNLHPVLDSVRVVLGKATLGS